MSDAERAGEYMDKHPQVEGGMVRFAREWKSLTGRNEIGIGALCERVRWELAIETSDPDFKINNNYRAYYARKIMAEYSDLDGMFKLRSSAADQWLADRLAALDADEHGRFALFPEQPDGRNR